MKVRGLAATVGVAWVTGCALAPPPVVRMPSPPSPPPPSVSASSPRPNGGFPQEILTPPEENRVYRCSAGSCDYVLGPGDGVEVTLLGDPELPVRVFPVDSDGTLPVPYLGRVDAAGATLGEVRARIEAGLARWLRNPTVSLRLTNARAHRVTLRIPGRGAQEVALEGRTRLASLLGGRYDGPDRGTVVLRRGRRTWRVPLPQALDPGGAGGLVLDEGDAITVVPAGPARFYVIGEVRRQGAYPLDAPVDVLQAVAQAGGFSSWAQRDLVAVLRPGPGGTRVLPVRPGHAGPTLQPGDVVYVGRSKTGDWNAFLEQIRPTLEVLNLTSATGLNTRHLVE